MQDQPTQEEDIIEEDFVYCVAPSPAYLADGICFAGRPSGLYRTEDGGDTWQPAYETLNLTADLATPAVAVSPNFPKDRTVWAGVQGGVLRSWDGGQNWQISMLPTPPPLVSAIAISPDYVNDGVLFLATMEDGVYRSNDRGTTWQRWNFGLLDMRVLTVAVAPTFERDETVFAATETGVYRSTNGGRAWRETTPPEDNAPIISLAISPGYAKDGMLLAGTDSGGMYVSEDRGKKWRRLGEDVFTGAINNILLSPSFPAPPYIGVLHEDTLMVSLDLGKMWIPWPLSLREPVDPSLTAVAAPGGIGPGHPVLAGLLDGRVIVI